MSDKVLLSRSRAEWVIETCDMVRALLGSGRVAMNADLPDSPAWIAMNASGAELLGFSVVQLVNTDNRTNRPRCSADAPADIFGESGPIAVTAARSTADGSGASLQSGRILRIRTDGSGVTPGTRWSPVVGAHHLAPDVFGRFEALGEDEIAEVGVFFDHLTPVLMREAKPDADVSAGSTGTFSVYSKEVDTGTNVTAAWKWATDSETLLEGTEGYIYYMADRTGTTRWLFVGGACAP